MFVREVEGVDPDDALARAGEYLAEQGYSAKPGEGAPTWQRGESLGGLFAMAMRRLRTEVALEAVPREDGVRLTLRYTVNDFGQFITATNRRFWDVEAAEVTDHADGLPVNTQRRAAYAADARRDARRFVLVSTAFALAASALIVGLAWSLFAPPA